jgi:diadenosine tetraphosphate (Ap4A) HIT family hydrolase
MVENASRRGRSLLAAARLPLIAAVPLVCHVCQSNSGAARISPAPPVYEGKHWLVEHAYPSALLGWLVIVLKRHAEALHVLTEDECAELGALQWAVARTVASQTGCEKEYVALFAEMPGFHHVHFHVAPRAADLAAHLRGSKVFAFLQATRDDVVAPDRVVAFCERASREVSDILSSIRPA